MAGGEALANLTLGDDPRTRALAVTLKRAGVLTITELRTGLEIETRSYVGRVVVGPLDLTIVPKVAWQRWHVLFGYALRLRGLVRSDSGDAQLRPTSLQDLLVLQLVVEARDLIGRGLHREYVRQRAVLTSPRGRIDFRRIAAQGGLLEASVPCRYTRRIDDAVLNRTLLAGLLAAATVAGDVGLRADARRLAHEMEATVDHVPLDRRLLRDAHGALDRRTARYAPALRLIELLHVGQAVTLDDDPENSHMSMPGFALDMNSLWQRLLARVLAEWGDEMEVRQEVSLSGVIAQDPAFSPKPRHVKPPRPDFAVYRNAKLTAYLDAKYRDLWNTRLPREMLYQLALYATAQGQGAAAMLYPTEDIDAVEERLLIRDPGSGATRAAVALRPVLLARLEDLIAQPATAARTRARAEIARRLCGLA